MHRKLILISTMSAVLLLPLPMAAASVCAPSRPLQAVVDDADLVFVGTVISTEWQGRVATFRVEEVWRGQLGATVLVNGGLDITEMEAALNEGVDLWSSGDRTYQTGARYLVVPWSSEGDMLRDNNCSPTQLYSAELDELRPASVLHPAEPQSGSPSSAAVAAGAVAAIAGLAMIAIRRFRSSESIPAA